MRFWERPKKEFIIGLLFDEKGNEIAKMRVRFFIKNGKLENYVAQLEYKLKGFFERWKVVVRHNCYHGFSHKDMFTASGKKRKVELGKFTDMNEAVEFAIKDISNNFESYIREYERG